MKRRLRRNEQKCKRKQAKGVSCGSQGQRVLKTKLIAMSHVLETSKRMKTEKCPLWV